MCAQRDATEILASIPVSHAVIKMVSTSVCPLLGTGEVLTRISITHAATMKELVHGMCFHGVLSYASFKREGQGQLH